MSIHDNTHSNEDANTPAPTPRRRFLQRALAGAGATLLLPALAGSLSTAAGGCGDDSEPEPEPETDPLEGVEFPVYDEAPFQLGIASGDPDASGFVLWTRLAFEPLADDGLGGMSADDVPVAYEIATDVGFTDVVRVGVETAEQRWAHSVHAIVSGLEPDSWYFYRFFVGDQRSDVGRARTLPTAGADVASFSFAVTSCQEWREGYYASHRHLANEADLDVVLFLGDYIYEYGLGTNPVVRPNLSGPVTTLADYRHRHAQYKSDADLQAAHRRCPWVTIWDDHEVQNNYAADISEKNDEPPATFLDRRSDAYQAYWEHMPLRMGPPSGPDLQTYRGLEVGRLAEVFMLDTRQYRSEIPCGGIGIVCDDLAAADLLGADQQAWLTDGLESSGARWKIIGNQVVFSPTPIRLNPNAPAVYNFDQWDGYPSSREAVVDAISRGGVEDVIFFTGDIHALGVARVHAISEDETSPVIATEFVAPSTTSDASELSTGEATIEAIPWVERFDITVHGYAHVTLTPESATCVIKVVEDIADANAAQRVDSTWVVDTGVAGPRLV